MGKILEKFAVEKALLDNRSFKHNSEYGQLLEKLVDVEGKILETLNDTEKGLLEEFLQAQSGINCLTATDNFVYGYRLGVLMTMEVFTTNNDTVLGGEA